MLNFANEALLLTNFWVILYLGLLDFLNFTHPPKTPQLTLDVNPLPNPEPFDIPLYIFLSVLIIGGIWLYELFSKRTIDKFLSINLNKTFLIILKVFAFIFLLGIFIEKLGPFPLAFDPFPYKLQPDRLIYWIFFIAYIVAVCFLTFQLVAATKIFRKKIHLPLIYIILLVIVGLITFDGKFYVQAHDARFFYGPVWEITHGKTIITDIPSLYGFLSVLFFSLIQKVTHINFIYLPLVIWVMFITEYIIIFHLIFKTSKSLLLALLAFFSLLTTNYFAVYHLPQGMSLRWLPLVLAVYLFYRYKRFDSKPLLFILPLLSLWAIDSGLALMLGYISTVGLTFLLRKISLKQLFSIIFYLFISTLSILLGLNIIHLFLGMRPIEYWQIYETLRKTSVTGLLMMPMEFQTYFWLFMLVYFSSIIYFIRNTKQTVEYRGWKIDKEARGSRIEKFYLLSSIFKFQPSTFSSLPSSNLQLLLFSANLMLFASIYYVGRSMPHSLFQLSPLFILTLFLLIGDTFRHLQSIRIRALLVFFIFIFLIVIPAYYKKEYFTSDLLFKQGLFKNGFFKSWYAEVLPKKFGQEVKLINTYMRENEVIILSVDESYLFYMVNKRNLLDANPQAAVTEPGEIDRAVRRAIQVCPQRIAVDCKMHNRCPHFKSLTDGWFYVIPSILERIEKKCKVRYVPIICAGQLCIAEKTKYD